MNKDLLRQVLSEISDEDVSAQLPTWKKRKGTGINDKKVEVGMGIPSEGGKTSAAVALRIKKGEMAEAKGKVAKTIKK